MEFDIQALAQRIGALPIDEFMAVVETLQGAESAFEDAGQYHAPAARVLGDLASFMAAAYEAKHG